MLEDDFSDVMRKAERGRELEPATVASRSGLPAKALAAWRAGKAVPGDAQARLLARVLGLDPGKLADRAGDRWHPSVALPADVRHHPHDPHPSNGYILFLEAGTAALVDPAGLPSTLVRAVAEGPFALTYILITHRHADHCDAAGAMARDFPQATIAMHGADIDEIGALANGAIVLKDGDELPFGDHAAIRAIHTPGHTEGSTCFLFKGDLFSGDTLFAGSVGGAFGENTGYRDILAGVREKLFTLGDDIVVMPGHGPPTTIREERAHNPFF